MPNNADHLHYYVHGKGKYQRKLVDKEFFMLILLSGGKVAKNQSYNVTGIVSSERLSEMGKRFKKKITGKVYFPYSVIDWTHAAKNGVITKTRAKYHNRCLQCGPLEAYWNQGGSNEQGN